MLFQTRINTIVVVSILIVSVLGSSGLGTVAAAGTTDVEVTPETTTIDAGTTTTINITATDISSDGLGSYEFELSTSGTGTASITDVTLRGNPGLSETNISEDGSQLNVSAGVLSTSETGSVTLATVTIAGDAAGETTLSLSDVSVSDNDGNAYSIQTAVDGTLSIRESTVVTSSSVSPAEVNENQTVATTFEFDVADVSSDGNTDQFTLNGSDRVTFSDPTVTVTDRNGSPIQTESNATVQDTAGGSDNQLAFAIAPDNSLNTSEVAVSIQTQVTYPSVGANQSTEFVLDVTDSSGETATDTVDVQLINSERDPGSDTVSVTLAPTQANVSTGSTVTYDLVATGVTDGVGSYNITVNTGNSTVAGLADGTLEGNPGGASVTVAPDNSSVTLVAGFGADISGADEVTLGTVTVSGGAAGTAQLTPSANQLFDQSGNGYSVSSVSNATVEVTAGPGDITGNGQAANDLDNDGVYEDINGDNSVNIGDVQALFNNLNSDAVQNNPNLFNINGEGGVNIGDVQALFSRV